MNLPAGVLAKAGLWSGRRDSNPRPIAWKAMTLPTELLPLSKQWWRGEDSNLRSPEGRWVYSPVPLTARPPLQRSARHGNTLLCFGHPPKWIPGSLQVSRPKSTACIRSNRRNWVPQIPSYAITALVTGAGERI
jgi:hypothetical protein